MNIVMITPINVEYQAIRKHLTSPQFKHILGISYEVGTFKGLNHNFRVALRQSGSQNENLTLATKDAIQHFNPDLIILTGIAGGVKDVDIGDIVVANKLYGYESGKEISSGFVARPELVYCSPDLVEFSKSISNQADWKERIINPSEIGKVFLGPIASGNKVIASKDSEVYKRLKTHFNDTLAIEMEAIGFGKAMLHNPLVKFINIRAVSDLLDNKSGTDGEGNQEKVMANVAGFVFEFLYQLDFSKLNTPEIMELKKLVQEVFEEVFPVIEEKAGIATGTPTTSRAIVMLEKLKPLLGDAYQDIIDDPKDEDNHADFRKKMKKSLVQNEHLQRELSTQLEEIKEIKKQEGHTIIIQDSKNVIANSTLNSAGNMHLGDTVTNNTDNSKTVNIQGNQSPVYVGEVIHIRQIVESTIPQQVPTGSAGIRNIQDLVSANKIKSAIEELLRLTKNQSPNIHHQAIILAGRWNRLKKEQRMGIISKGQSNVEENNILASLLDTILELE